MTFKTRVLGVYFPKHVSLIFTHPHRCHLHKVSGPGDWRARVYHAASVQPDWAEVGSPLPVVGPLQGDNSPTGCHLAPVLCSVADTNTPTGYSFSKPSYLTGERPVLNPLLAFISYRKGSFLVPSSYSSLTTDMKLRNCVFCMF